MKYLLFFLLINFIAAEEKTILGSGRWQFEFLKEAILLPQEHAQNVQDYHGIAVDKQGRVYVGYYSKKANKDTRAVARFTYQPDQNPPFIFDKFLGDSSWNKNRLHGLNIITMPNGQERLLLIYNKQQVILADLDGNTQTEYSFNITDKVFKKASDGNYSPKSKNLGIYDGYATNKLHELDAKNGSNTGHSHGKKGKGFKGTNTAHGMGVDPSGNYVIADRGNKRLVWRAPDFSPIVSKQGSNRHVQLATPGLEVCNVQFKEDFAVLPCLNSSLAFLKKSTKEECGYELESSFKMPQELIKQGFDGIHDANFSIDNKYVIVAVWQRNRKVAPTLFALKRLGESKK
ncbi:MAG: hypothetical protein NE330_14740 [Lentisphaeraceae bacterium]|nr:hypothetical protein [Lentisphaeraceae bacterium]